MTRLFLAKIIASLGSYCVICAAVVCKVQDHLVTSLWQRKTLKAFKLVQNVILHTDGGDGSLLSYRAPLSFVSETCRDVLCPGSSTCVVDQNNNANCVTCNRICPEPTSPEQYLCGNDGITYASACHLRKATCLLGRSIGLAYEGKCISKYDLGERSLRGCVEKALFLKQERQH